MEASLSSPLDQVVAIAETLAKGGNAREAEQLFRSVLEREPDNAGARSGLDALLSAPPVSLVEPLVALQRQGRSAEVVTQGALLLGRYPRSAFLHNLQGVALAGLGRIEQAADHYRRAITLEPDNAAAVSNLGNLLRAAGREDEAIAAYDRALAIDPELAEARMHRLHLLAYRCDWDAIAAEGDRIATLGIDGAPASPFAMLPADDHLERQLRRAQRFAAHQFRQVPLAPPAPPAGRPDRIRIGYFSADFHDHATMHLIAGMFEHHDRSRFAIHAYSYGPAANDAMRRRLIAHVDQFHDVRSMDDEAVAGLARAEGIDIAVDLKGYTHGTRSGILAFRPAPVQINYLGYPGTMGAPFIDYIIADRTVIPDTHRHGYTEKIIYLPHSYQANDDRRAISHRPISRREAGLPQDAFVFCCFNSHYKFGAAEFVIWMRLLARVEGSVLWLLEVGAQAARNLAEAARRHGVDPARLIFAGRLATPEHLARHAHADLFLDTFNVNAHTTASDALWAGLPIVTRAGQSFAARVAASLLTAIGLPELITATSEDYERLALDLARDRPRLAAIRARLADQRLSTPLFDAARFTRHIEEGYRQAFQRHADGQEPDTIEVRS